jgi:AcrR family transcriptional regulator
MARKYELKQRAKLEEQTRLRIVEAAVNLHEEIGDKLTTVSAIAERAGVGRVTVYRHFPDERALLTACTSHYLGANPVPDPTLWAGIADPWQRLEVALTALYAYYRRNEGMLARAEHDAPANPILTELMAPLQHYQAGLRDLLAAGCPADSFVVAAIGHALAFTTWHSLARDQGLDDAQAVAMMLTLVRCATSSRDAPD